MGLKSWLRNVLKVEKEAVNDGVTIEPISILKTETPEKTVVTRVKPVKIPTIIDIGERLGLISRDLADLKYDIVTKSWFRSEFENVDDIIIKKLKNIESNLNSLHDSLDQLNRITKELSNNLSNRAEKLIKRLSFPEKSLNIPDKILGIIQENKNIRYKDIVKRVNISEPTLCKHLKTLLKTNKITRTRKGRAVYYKPL